MTQATDSKIYKITQVLTTAVSPETAYLQADYAYGRKGRCLRRNYLEFSTRRDGGFRYCYQTSAPYYDLPAAPTVQEIAKWNKPKGSVYAPLAILVTTDNYENETGEGTSVQMISWTGYDGFLQLKIFLSAFSDKFNDTQRQVASQLQTAFDQRFGRKPQERPAIQHVKVLDFQTREVLKEDLDIDDGFFGAAYPSSAAFPPDRGINVSVDKLDASTFRETVLDSHLLGRQLLVQLLA